MLKVVAHGGDLSGEERDAVSAAEGYDCIFIDGFQPANQYMETPYMPRYVYDILNQPLENGINHHTAHIIHRSHEVQLPMYKVPTKFTSGKDIGCSLVFLRIHAQFDLMYSLTDNGESDFVIHIMNVDFAPLTIQRYIKGFERLPNVVVAFEGFEDSKARRIMPLDDGNNVEIQFAFDKVRYDRLARQRNEAEEAGVRMTPFNREGNSMINQRPHGNHIIADRIEGLTEEDRAKLDGITKKGRYHKRTNKNDRHEVEDEVQVDLLEADEEPADIVVEEPVKKSAKKAAPKTSSKKKVSAVDIDESEPSTTKKKKKASESDDDAPKKTTTTRKKAVKGE